MSHSLIHKKHIIIFVLISLFSLILSCDEYGPTGDIEGSVFFMGTDIPAEGVTVEIGGMTTLSSEEGTYRIDGIPTGNYILKAEKTGFIQFSSDIKVIEGLNTLLIPMISPEFTSRVQGVITGNFTGNSKPGLSVVLLNTDGSESDINGTTNEEGYYQLQYVPFGDRTLVVKSSDSVIHSCDVSLSTLDHYLDIVISEPMVFTDPRDGKNYAISKIGNQVWFVENLTYLPIVSPPDSKSDSLELYHVYGYQGTDPVEAKVTSNYTTYGVLYNWPAAMTGCPEGWHLPGDSEWKILEIFLGMEPEDADQVKWRNTGEVGAKLKSLSGWDSNGSGNNSSGFNALPGGSRGTTNNFSGIGMYCNFWTSSLNSISLPWNRFLSYDNNGVSRYGLNRSLEFSVRCVKDE